VPTTTKKENNRIKRGHSFAFIYNLFSFFFDHERHVLAFIFELSLATADVYPLHQLIDING
jgi:hypothetical protein